MHFRRVAAVLCAVLGATLVGASAAAPKVAVSGHTFKVNGKNVAPQAYNIDGYNYFKLRDVAYLLADTTAPFNVTWSASQSTVVNIVPVQKYQKVGGELSSSTLTSLKVIASTFKVLMEGKTLPLRGYLINGNNYYSIADIAESVGFEAGWDNATRTVSITTPDHDPEQPGNNGGSNGSDNTPTPTPKPTPAPTPTPKPTPAPTPTPVFTTGVYEVNVSSTLTVRSGPGTSYSSVGQLSKGDKVVVDSLSNGWAQLMETAGGSGRYVSAEY